MRAVFILTAACMAATACAGTPEGSKGLNAKACFESIKKLAGEWTAKDPKTGKETVLLKYRLTAGGSAVEETVMPGEPHEMITMYHMDGDALMLTHYCAVGNQPRMRATPESTPSRIEFRCAGGSNMKSHDDMHMHHAVMTLPDSNRLNAEWTAYQKGKKSDHSVKFNLTRKSAE